MTEKKEVGEETRQERKGEGQEDTLSSLFEERDCPVSPPVVEKEPVEEKRAPSRKLSLKKEEQEETETSQQLPPDPAEAEEDKEPQEDSDLRKLREELEKTRKDLQTNRSYGRQNSQKVKTALKAVQNLIEEGSLSEEEAQGLLSSLQIDQEREEETPLLPAHPFAPIFKTVGAELEHLRKYTEDEALEDKLTAFEYLIGTAPAEETEEILETLMDLIEEPVKLTREVIAIGTEAYENFYKEIRNAGGTVKYIDSLKKNQESLQKKIDKLTKKLSQYEDYDRPHYRISEMGETENDPHDKDTIGTLFEERDRSVRR